MWHLLAAPRRAEQLALQHVCHIVSTLQQPSSIVCELSVKLVEMILMI
jgi:hypothetical protein